MELRRNPRRFAVATITLTLIAVLLMFLGALLDGLLQSITGSYLAQPGQLIVVSSNANSTLGASVLDAAQLEEITAALPDGAEAGSITSLTLGARVSGGDERTLTDVTLFGVEIAPDGVPLDDLAAGEVWADADLGFSAGDELLVGPGRAPVTVAGIVGRGDSPSEGALWASAETWLEVQADARPGGAMPEGFTQGLIVVLPDDAPIAETAAAIDTATGTTTSLTIAEAITAIPGVAAQNTTFTQIRGVTVAIALLVVSLFFALLTVERTGLYGVLKAMGSRSSRIFAGVLLQALAVTALASAVGTALVVLTALLVPPGAVPFALSVRQILLAIGALALSAVLGSAFSLRRILRIEPAAAIGGDA